MYSIKWLKSFPHPLRSTQILLQFFSHSQKELNHICMLIWEENIQDCWSNGEPLSLVQLNKTLYIHFFFNWGTTLYVTQVISHLGRHFHYTYSIYFCLLKIMHTLFSKALMYLFLYFIGNWTICFHGHNYIIVLVMRKL